MTRRRVTEAERLDSDTGWGYVLAVVLVWVALVVLIGVMAYSGWVR